MHISEWKARGAELAQAHKAQQFDIAYWLLAGTELQVDSAAYAEAERLFPQYSHQTFKEWVNTARAYPQAYVCAYANLTFSHFRAALKGVTRPFAPADTPAERAAVEAARAARRQEWLSKAEAGCWSVARLAGEIQAAELKESRAATALPTPTPEEKPVEEKPNLPTPKEKPVPEYRLPLTSSQDLALYRLAKARGMHPADLAALAVAEYLESHEGELAAAEYTEDKERLQHIRALNRAAKGPLTCIHQVRTEEKCERCEAARAEYEAKVAAEKAAFEARQAEVVAEWGTQSEVRKSEWDTRSAEAATLEAWHALGKEAGKHYAALCAWPALHEVAEAWRTRCAMAKSKWHELKAAEEKAAFESRQGEAEAEEAEAALAPGECNDEGKHGTDLTNADQCDDCATELAGVAAA